VPRNDKLLAKNLELEDRAPKAEGQLADAVKAHDAHRADCVQMRLSRNSWQKRAADLGTELADIRDRIKTVESDNKLLDVRCAGLESELAITKETIHDLRNQLAASELRREAAERRNRSLKGLVDQKDVEAIALSTDDHQGIVKRINEPDHPA
jgi:chromosome segregation ATPase